MHARTLNMYTSSIKEYMNESQQIKIYMYCSMNKQYVEGVQKREMLTCCVCR